MIRGVGAIRRKAALFQEDLRRYWEEKKGAGLSSESQEEQRLSYTFIYITALPALAWAMHDP